MSEYVIVSGTCMDGDCDCNENDGLPVSKAGYPPFHEGCTCYVAVDIYKKSFDAEANLPPCVLRINIKGE